MSEEKFEENSTSQDYAAPQDYSAPDMSYSNAGSQAETPVTPVTENGPQTESWQNQGGWQQPQQPEFQNHGFIKKNAVLQYAERLIKQYDVRSGQGPATIARSMSGGNQQKAIIAREVDKDPQLLVAVQPTRGLDVGAIEYIHKQIVAERDKGRAVLLVSLELDEVMNLSDRILVIYEGEIVGEFDPKKTTVEELGLYMAGAKKQGEAKA